MYPKIVKNDLYLSIILHILKLNMIYFIFYRDYPTHSRTKHKRPQKVWKHLNNPVYNAKDKLNPQIPPNFIPVSMIYLLGCFITDLYFNYNCRAF